MQAEAGLPDAVRRAAAKGGAQAVAAWLHEGGGGRRGGAARLDLRLLRLLHGYLG